MPLRPRHPVTRRRPSCPRTGSLNAQGWLRRVEPRLSRSKLSPKCFVPSRAAATEVQKRMCKHVGVRARGARALTCGRTRTQPRAQAAPAGAARRKGRRARLVRGRSGPPPRGGARRAARGCRRRTRGRRAHCGDRGARAGCARPSGVASSRLRSCGLMSLRVSISCFARRNRHRGPARQAAHVSTDAIGFDKRAGAKHRP